MIPSLGSMTSHIPFLCQTPAIFRTYDFVWSDISHLSSLAALGPEIHLYIFPPALQSWQCPLFLLLL